MAAAELPRALGVVGAGTMGAGIAQLGVLAGLDTYMHDPVPEALERGGERVHRGLAKGAERGRWPEEVAVEAEARLVLATSLEELAKCELVIEAAPERIELKRELFERLSEVCGPETVLATNTSSILVSSLASAASRPENVVGMHFFNPPPLMHLLEVIAATQTGERALSVARLTGDAMGKRVIVASDGPGFLVNRCGRAFGAEALRLLQERVATHEQIDRVCRRGGGFRMGPFELMDLVGIDVGFEVAKSFDAQSFGEPRWKPNLLQARMVAAGRLGRKTGACWHEYGSDGPHRTDDPPTPEAGGGDGGRVAVDGAGAAASEPRQRARAAGFDAREPGEFGGDEEPELVLDASVPAPLSDLGVEAPATPPAPGGGAPRHTARPARAPVGRLEPARTRRAARGRVPPAAPGRAREAGGAHAAGVDAGHDGRGVRGLLRAARDARGMGRRRARPRAGPNRLPTRERGGVRRGRGRRRGVRRGRGSPARPQPPAWTRGLGR